MQKLNAQIPTNKLGIVASFPNLEQAKTVGNKNKVNMIDDVKSCAGNNPIVSISLSFVGKSVRLTASSSAA